MLKNRIFLWDNLKVFLMMLVVMTHSVCIYQNEGDAWLPFLWIFTMTFTMPLFTMISGFWYKPRTVSYGVKRYLFPCIIFSVVNMFWGGK